MHLHWLKQFVEHLDTSDRVVIICTVIAASVGAIVAYHIAAKQGSFARGKVRLSIISGDHETDRKSLLPWLIVFGIPLYKRAKSYLVMIPFGLVNRGKVPVRNLWCQICFPPHLAPLESWGADQSYEEKNFTRRVERFPHQVFVEYDIKVLRPGEQLGIREALRFDGTSLGSLSNLEPNTFVGPQLDFLESRIDVVTITLLAENFERDVRQFQVVAVASSGTTVLQAEASIAVPLAMALATRGQRIRRKDAYIWWLLNKIKGSRPILLYQKDFKKVTKEGIGIDDLLTEARLGSMSFNKMELSLYNANILVG